IARLAWERDALRDHLRGQSRPDPRPRTDLSRPGFQAAQILIDSRAAPVVIAGALRRQRDADWHRAHAVDEIGVGAARWRQYFDNRIARQQLLPQDAQLQFGEPVADAAMDAEAE